MVLDGDVSKFSRDSDVDWVMEVDEKIFSIRINEEIYWINVQIEKRMIVSKDNGH